MTSDAEDGADSLEHSRSASPAAEDQESGGEEGPEMAEHPEIKSEGTPNGLQDGCHDGVRKKAKYLHDAPPEALVPGAQSNLFNPAAARYHDNALHHQDAAAQQAHSNSFYPANPQTYGVYHNKPMAAPQMMPETDLPIGAFGQQQSPVSPSFNQPMPQSIGGPNVVQQSPDTTNSMPNAWNGAYFDPSDPALFNFDLASMNFGNHYGALEFGMLGHMATNAGETPSSDAITQRGSVGQINGSNQYTPSVSAFAESPSTQQAPMYSDIQMSDWSNGNQAVYQTFQQPDAPNAFIIDNTPNSFTSPESISSPQGHMNANFEDSPTLGKSGFKRTPPTATTTPIHSQTSMPKSTAQATQGLPFQPPRQPQIPTATKKPNSGPRSPQVHGSRFADTSEIYTSISAPYSYTDGFHSQLSYIRQRFGRDHPNRMRIAKALSSIRPSFIATTKTLNRDDLIFMEKCFQRTLWEYYGFIENCGTPTIIARRTGEIVAVGKEFSLVSGWSREVLLGREPNLNVNRGGSSTAATSVSGDTTGQSGYTTPRLTTNEERLASGEQAQGRPQPVFLAELLDDESVCRFYEDFARLAFGDSRGSARGHCTLLKYKTKDQLQFPSPNGADGSLKTQAQSFGRGSGVANGKSSAGQRAGVTGPVTIENLGAREGKVECAYCWTVKRDVFDIPMLIVMNVSAGCLSTEQIKQTKNIVMLAFPKPTFEIGFSERPALFLVFSNSLTYCTLRSLNPVSAPSSQKRAILYSHPQLFFPVEDQINPWQPLRKVTFPEKKKTFLSVPNFPPSTNATASSSSSKPQKMPTQYDSIGSSFNLMQTLPIAPLESSNLRAALPANLSTSSVLDLACGTGRYAQLLVREWGAKRVLGVDISEVMVEEARRAVTEEERVEGRIEYRVGDCGEVLGKLKLKFMDDGEEGEGEGEGGGGGGFDVVVGAWLLNYAKDEEQMRAMWRNIADNLREGGLFVGVTPALARTEYDQFGVKVERVRKVEGGWKMRVTAHFGAAGGEGGEVVFENYLLDEEIYRRCAEESGMRGVEFRKPVVTEGFTEGLGERMGGNLDGWQENPHFGICVARKGE
ncbi:MAG: hypothetical protein Q9227_004287 [Pyrenula ochraceoflavens]